MATRRKRRTARRNPSRPRGHKPGCRCVVCDRMPARSNPSRPKRRAAKRRNPTTRTAEFKRLESAMHSGRASAATKSAFFAALKRGAKR